MKIDILHRKSVQVVKRKTNMNNTDNNPSANEKILIGKRGVLMTKSYWSLIDPQ